MGAMTDAEGLARWAALSALERVYWVMRGARRLLPDEVRVSSPYPVPEAACVVQIVRHEETGAQSVCVVPVDARAEQAAVPDALKGLVAERWAQALRRVGIVVMPG